MLLNDPPDLGAAESRPSLLSVRLDAARVYSAKPALLPGRGGVAEAFLSAVSRISKPGFGRSVFFKVSRVSLMFATLQPLLKSEKADFFFFFLCFRF